MIKWVQFALNFDWWRGERGELIVESSGHLVTGVTPLNIILNFL